MGKVIIKTDVLDRPHWGIGEGLTSLRFALAVVFCLPPLLCPSVCPQDKKLMLPMYMLEAFLSHVA